MAAEKDRLLELISEIGHEISQFDLSRLGPQLKRMGKDNVLQLLPEVLDAAPPRFRERLRVLVDLWMTSGESASGEALALSLEAAQRIHEAEHQSKTIELVWTGPESPEVRVRRSDVALLELIDQAKSELWIVSFAVYDVKSVEDAIVRACQRGVRVSLLLESADGSEGKLRFDVIAHLRKRLPAEVRFLEWPKETRPRDDSGASGALHAKCALADGMRLLVSSANLTGYALNLNIELGVLIKDADTAGRLSRHFEGLLSRGCLRERAVECVV